MRKKDLLKHCLQHVNYIYIDMSQLASQARLKRNVSVVSKVGTIIQQQNGQQRNSVDHKALPYTHLTHRKEWNGAPHPGSPSVAASVPGWGQRPSMQ